METKQVIVVRTRFINEKQEIVGVRAGKILAQACHATMAFVGRRLQQSLTIFDRIKLAVAILFFGNKAIQKHLLSKQEIEWFDGSFAKICLEVRTEEDLIRVHKSALAAHLESHLIVDSGRTEFGGKATPTAVAIGPAYVSEIDPVTKHLKLY